jgi:hypothetical protein
MADLLLLLGSASNLDFTSLLTGSAQFQLNASEWRAQKSRENTALRRRRAIDSPDEGRAQPGSIRPFLRQAPRKVEDTKVGRYREQSI